MQEFLNKATARAISHATRVHSKYHMDKPYPIDPDWQKCEQRTCRDMKAIVEDIAAVIETLEGQKEAVRA